VKRTNGDDADAAPGPQIRVGDPVTWTYEVHNTGSVPLSNVVVTDNVAGVTPVYVSGDLNNDGKLDLSEVWLFQAQGTAVAGQYANTGTVTGTPPTGSKVSASNPSHYFGVDPGIALTKYTNGFDADLAPGPEITIGQPITWTYYVTNTGDVP